MIPRILVLLTILLASFAHPMLAGEYKKIVEDGITYHAFIANPEELNIHWKRDDGTPYRKLDALAADLKNQGHEIQFLGNAGIFMEGGMPLGLHIENGKTLRKVNKVKEAYGNFYLQPNGIFFIEKEKARVVTTDKYLRGDYNPRLATQSGPMLLIDGKIHPKFNPDSKHLFYRNGVGVLPDGKVILIITDHAFLNTVNLYNFASLFKKQGCENALFLDGGLSAVRIPAAELKIETGIPLGPLLSVTK